jgi:hypothetical protein
VESGRTHGWTISITSSAPEDDDPITSFAVESHGSVPPLPSAHRSVESRDRVIPRDKVRTTQRSPRLPGLLPPIPRLAHDRVVLTEEDYSRLRTRAMCALVIGIVFPPLWLMMGWGHALDEVMLPYAADEGTREQVLLRYLPYRRTAAVLSVVIVLAALSGIIVGGLVVGGVIA